MRIVVTGAAGFLGRHVASHLQSVGHEVVGFDRDAIENVVLTEVVRGDFLDTEYQALVAEIDRIADDTDFAGTKLLDGSIQSIASNSSSDCCADSPSESAREKLATIPFCFNSLFVSVTN